MHLWTDYEGKTIAGDYPLTKLLRSEGRNAFFSASDPKGNSAVVRLTEAHFDESEMLKRWSKVVDLHQSSLLEIEKFGETTVDGVVLAYAVLEPNDANLQDMLNERPLTSAETLQVARNVASALRALHASGLVHEHVEAANILAVGEDVKLRSDCVRECVADMEFSSAEECAQLRRKDVHDLGTLLLRCLTLEQQWQPATRLPQPFAQIVPRALDGTWSLDQILAALEPSAAAPQPAAPAGTKAAGTRPTPRLVPEYALGKSAAVALPVSRLPEPGKPEDQATVPAANSAQSSQNPPHPADDAIRLRPRTYVPPIEHASLRPRSVWALGLAAAALILLGWYFLFHPSTRPAPAASRIAAASPVRRITPEPAPATHTPTQAAPTLQAATTAAQPGWRVIAYTYNHQGQAQAQASRLARKHPGLNPQVFSPRGHAPFLVALSGPVTEPEAKAILNRARRSGAPRDTFIRRY